MSLISDSLTIVSSIASIAASFVMVATARKPERSPKATEMSEKPMLNTTSPIAKRDKRRSLAALMSLFSLAIGFSDVLFVMFGPPRDVPLTGETGALLAYGLFFIFMGFYLRQR